MTTRGNNNTQEVCMTSYCKSDALMRGQPKVNEGSVNPPKEADSKPPFRLPINDQERREVDWQLGNE